MITLSRLMHKVEKYYEMRRILKTKSEDKLGTCFFVAIIIFSTALIYATVIRSVVQRGDEGRIAGSAIYDIDAHNMESLFLEGLPPLKRFAPDVKMKMMSIEASDMQVFPQQGEGIDETNFLRSFTVM